MPPIVFIKTVNRWTAVARLLIDMTTRAGDSITTSAARYLNDMITWITTVNTVNRYQLVMTIKIAGSLLLVAKTIRGASSTVNRL
jgi:hypothetical protein